MSGFVDPAFKSINIKEPNFFIWRISKLKEENYEAKLIAKEYYGNFHDEDSYIAFNCAPVKRVPGRSIGTCNSGTEVHIHFWLGSLASEDQCKRTILKSMELDEVLEGVGTLHRELQGHESSRFLSYFRKGMFIKKGEIANALKQNYVDVNPKLYKVSQRASTVILTEQPEISWSYINSKSVYVLKTMCRHFVWIGSEATHEDKYLAHQVEEINNSNTNVVWVVDGKEDELAPNELADFEEHLNLESKSMKSESADEDLLLFQSEFRRITELYKVTRGDCCNVASHVKDGPLEQSDLDARNIYIIYHCCNAIWVWIGKRASAEERSKAINAGIVFQQKRFGGAKSKEGKINVNRVVEGYEPQEFKLLFKTWIDSFSANSDNYFQKKLARPVNNNFSAEKLENSPFLAADTQLLDCGSGQMSVLIVGKDGLLPLDPEEFGIFHSKSKYIVHYSYTVHGEVKKIFYYWLGNGLLNEEKADIWPNIKHISDFQDTYARVRIEQHKETPHFHAIFRGKIIIMNSKIPPSSGKKMVLDRFPFLLLKVIGGDVTNTFTVEVNPDTHSLDTNNVFIVRTPRTSYVWCGAGSKGDEREMARSIANKWTRGYQVIVEGCEDPGFRKIIETHRLRIRCDIKVAAAQEINVPATLYKCSLCDEGLMVSEILNFGETNLSSHGTFILDAWDIIFIWTGKDVPEEERSEDARLVADYLRSDPCGRPWNLPVVHVCQNQEPPIFRGFFPTWTRAGKKTYDLEDKQRSFGSKEEPKMPQERTASVDEEVAAEETASETQPQGREEDKLNPELQGMFEIPKLNLNKQPPWKQKRPTQLAQL